MKKMMGIMFCVLMYVVTYNYTFAFDLTEIYEKIDVVYIKSPQILITVNDKIDEYIANTENVQQKQILGKVTDYIDFKLKNQGCPGKLLEQSLLLRRSSIFGKRLNFSNGISQNTQ